jgi:high frequency lysogenization protein
MNKTLSNQAIALAGMSQAVFLVQQIARKGRADQEDLETCIASVLKIDADDVLDVYGGLRRLRTGLRRLERQLGGPDTVDPEQARYASVIIFLERRMAKHAELLEAIRGGVQKAAAQAENLGVLHEEVLATLAETYQQTISRLKPRVMVVGEQIHLSDADNGQRIRALLLAAIRSTVLWRQCGGTRWTLLFSRQKLQRETVRLLAAL